LVWLSLGFSGSAKSLSSVYKALTSYKTKTCKSARASYNFFSYHFSLVSPNFHFVFSFFLFWTWVLRSKPQSYRRNSSLKDQKLLFQKSKEVLLINKRVKTSGSFKDQDQAASYLSEVDLERSSRYANPVSFSNSSKVRVVLKTSVISYRKDA
jgi:hypothetical protein